MPWLESAGRDVRHAWRMIARMPGIALVVVLSLGVGIGPALLMAVAASACWLSARRAARCDPMAALRQQ